MNIKQFAIGLFVLVCISGCIEVNNNFSKVPPGEWRAVLKLDETWNPDRSLKRAVMDIEPDIDIPPQSGQLPFNMEFVYTDDENFYVNIKNGPEVIKITDIQFGRDSRTLKDTIVINFPIYDSYIEGAYEEDFIEGRWVRKNRSNYSIPISIKHGENHRFSKLDKAPAMDISGNWEVTFTDADGESKGIGEFKMQGNKVNGTFRTETGDYRFLEGTLLGKNLYLSVFDGAHAFLFEAIVNPDQSLKGTFRSGNHYTANWTAVKNDNFELADPNTLTYLNEGYDKVEFSFENPEGKTISLSDPSLKGKVKLIQIMGTWCPNCRDETRFLVDYLKNNPNENLEVIALAFESYREKDKANEMINRYKKNFDMDYEMVYAGFRDKGEAGKVLPMLNKVISYPTLIFIDKNDKVRKIHTGFAGPATSQYAAFQKEFQETMEQLLKE